MVVFHGISCYIAGDVMGNGHWNGGWMAIYSWYNHRMTTSLLLIFYGIFYAILWYSILWDINVYIYIYIHPFQNRSLNDILMIFIDILYIFYASYSMLFFGILSYKIHLKDILGFFSILPTLPGEHPIVSSASEDSTARWLVLSTLPLWKVWVNSDDDIPYIWKNGKCSKQPTNQLEWAFTGGIIPF